MRIADRIKCPECDGCGTVPLPFPLANTLAYLREHGTLTAIDIYEALRVSEQRTFAQSAINNRLVALEQLGLVERVGKQYKTYLWKAKELKATEL